MEKLGYINSFEMFPSPLEVIGVSNATEDNSGVDFSKFPSPLEETGVSNKIAELDTEQVGNVSVPSRGDWGF